MSAMPRRRPDLPRPDPELLDAEVWEVPDRLSPDDCLIHAGPDWRRTPFEHADPEDDR